MTDFTLRLNDHDVEALRQTYANDGMVRIENLFPDDVAQAVYRVLAQNTPWHVVHSDQNSKHKYYRPEQWSALPQQQRNGTINDVLKRAQSGFAYLYNCYPMINALLKGEDPEWPLHVMPVFLNSPEFLDFTKRITNEAEVIKIDAQATLYAPGHFLNTHTDIGDNQERRAAYVMGFTKNWSRNWGGQLLFLNGSDVTRGFSPSFNTLTLFKVPREHIVTQVANFAGEGRYSITGWLRTDQKQA